MNDTPINSVWKRGAIDVRKFLGPSTVALGWVTYVRPGTEREKGQHYRRDMKLAGWRAWVKKAERIDG